MTGQQPRALHRPSAHDGQPSTLLWRTIIRRSLERADPSSTAIVPFGFEVLQQKTFFKARLRNFFVYVYGPREPQRSAEVAAGALREELAAVLRREQPSFFATVRCINTHQPFPILNPDGDRTIYVRSRSFASSPLLDYAKFILAFPASVATQQQLRAAQQFKSDPLARRYFFQLYIMYMAITDRDGLLADPDYQAMLAAVRTLSRADVATDPEGMFPVTQEELELFGRKCVPTLTRAFQTVQGMEGPAFDLSVDNFHGGGRLAMRMPLRWFRPRALFVARCYRSALNY